MKRISILQINIIILGITALFTTSSCVTLYSPNTIHTPLLSEKGDFSGNLGLGKGIDVQAAYAISDHVAVMGNAFFKNSTITQTSGSESFSVVHKQSMFEFAPGYFMQLGDQGLRFESFAGIGFGNVNDNKLSSYSDSSARDEAMLLYPHSTAGYLKIFIQPTIGITTKNFDASFAFRISNISINNINSEYNIIDGRDMNFWTMEPNLTVAAGFKYVKPFFQLGLILPAGGQTDYSSSNFSYNLLNPVSATIGLKVSINQQY